MGVQRIAKQNYHLFLVLLIIVFIWTVLHMILADIIPSSRVKIKTGSRQQKSEITIQGHLNIDFHGIKNQLHI